jgi:hypothetical protein
VAVTPIIPLFSLIGHPAAGVAWFGIRVNTFAPRGRRCVRGKPFPISHPAARRHEHGMPRISVSSS